MPRLSIIIPSHNGRKTIEECLTAIRTSHYNDYELIVVDDHSSDDTAEIANRFADKVIRLNENKGSGDAWKAGMEQAGSNIFCFIDSDIIIKPDIIPAIVDFLDRHPKVDAITGLLSKEHLHQNFFSQYKNLYMHYVFKLLPERVTFLFGSICALRKEAGFLDKCDMRYTPDTEFGQKLFLQGKTIAFLRGLEVTHLKKYTAYSFIKNDFVVPFCWARIFVRFKGLKQLARNNTGFAHAPITQLASVGLTPFILFLGTAGVFNANAKVLSHFLMIFWFALNARFFLFLFKERGLLFLLKAIGITFIDQLVMACGITAGFISELKTSLKFTADAEEAKPVSNYH